MKVKVFGTKTSGHQSVVSTIRKFTEKAQINCEIEEVSDVGKFLDMHLESVPAIQINDGEVISLRTNGAFHKSLRKVIKKILASEDFGILPKIIIPIDFSDVSTNAFHYGHRLATDMGAVVKLVHVHFMSASKINDGHQVNVDRDHSSNRQLEEFTEAVDVDWASELMTSALVQEEYRVGFPAQEILDVSDLSKPSLIIMGATGDRGGVATLFGSVSRQVMRDSNVPVLIIREGTRYKGINRFMYAYDDTDIHEECIMKMVEIARQFDAEIHVVNVTKNQTGIQGYELIELAKMRYPKAKLKLTLCESEDIVHGLNTYADEHQIDVIALGTTHKGVFKRLFGKSTTKQMSLNTSHPLLILKPQS